MSERKTLASPYMVYLEAVKTTKVYVRDVTCVPPVALALFGGSLKVVTLTPIPTPPLLTVQPHLPSDGLIS